MDENWRLAFTVEGKHAVPRHHGRAAVSADMALRFAAALGGSAGSWLQMQATHDLWQAAKKPRPRVLPLKLAA